MHLNDILYIDQLHKKTIMDCSHQGSCDEDVAYHQKRLNFTVDRDRAIHCLKEYGAWKEEELNAKDDEELAQIVLWIACGNFREYLHYCQEGYNPEDTPAGSDIFVLE